MNQNQVDEYWENKERKIWVVTIIPRARKPNDQKIVRAKTRETAIKTATANTLLKGRLNFRVRLANPISDLNCK